MFLRSFCLIILSLGTVIEALALISEGFTLYGRNTKNMKPGVKFQSLLYTREKFKLMVYKFIATYTTLFVYVYFARDIWKFCKRNYVYFGLIYFSMQTIIYIPSILYKELYIEYKYGFNVAPKVIYINQQTYKFILQTILFYAGIWTAMKFSGEKQVLRKGKIEIELDIQENGDKYELADKDFKDLPTIDANSKFVDEIFDDSAAHSNLWAITILILIGIMILYQIFYSLLFNFSNNLIPLNSFNATEQLVSFVGGFKPGYSKNLKIVNDTVTKHAILDLIGLLPYPVVSKRILDNFSVDEVHSLGVHTSYLMESNSNFVLFLISLFPVLIFGFVYRAIDILGLNSFQFRRSNPVAVKLFLTYAMYYVISSFARPFVLIPQKNYVLKADCYVGSQQMKLGGIIKKMAGINLEYVKHSTLYNMFYSPAVQIEERLLMITKCSKK